MMSEKSLINGLSSKLVTDAGRVSYGYEPTESEIHACVPIMPRPPNHFQMYLN